MMATSFPRKAQGLQSLGFGFAAMVGTAIVSIAAAAPLAERVPAEAIAYVGTSDVVELVRAWSNTGFSHLWQSPEFADFRDAFQKATRLSAGGQLSLLGINWSQLRGVASGEACLALVPVGENVGFILVVDVSQHADAAERLVADLRKQAPTRTYILSDGVLTITNRADLAKSPAKNLASSTAFNAISQQAGAAPKQVTWFVDPWELRPIMFAAETWDRLAQSGFKVIEAVGGRASFGSGDFDLDHQWFVYAPGKLVQGARLLDFLPLTDWSLPDWIPADVDSVMSVEWNLFEALPGCGSLFDEAYAEGEAGTFDAVLEDIKLEPTGPQVDIAELLKAQSGPVLGVAKTLEDGSTAVVYAVKVADEMQVAGALERMFAPDEGVEQRHVGKAAMWVFKVAKADAGPAMGPDLSGYALAAARNYWYVATSAQILERILAAAPSPKLTGDQKFQRLDAAAKKHRSKDAIGWRASIVAAGLRPLYASLRAQGEVDLGRLLGDPGNADHWLDLQKLPSDEILAEFIASGFGFINQTKEGWLLGGYIEKGAK